MRFATNGKPKKKKEEKNKKGQRTKSQRTVIKESRNFAPSKRTPLRFEITKSN